MDDATIRSSVLEKLHPNRIQLSAKFRALLGYLLDERWTNPYIVTLDITSDGFMNVWTSDGQNGIEGGVGDLDRNIRGVAEVAGLTAEETAWLENQVPARGQSGPVRGEIETTRRPAGGRGRGR